MSAIVVAADAAGLAQATAALARGALCVIPTETFYGLAADPRSAAAVQAVFAAKGRAAGEPLPLIAADREQVGLVAPGWELLRGAQRLAEHFWPGPLSLVVDARLAGVAPGVAGPDGSIAIRWTSHPVAALLARAVGFPLVATSANRSGEPAQRTASGAAAGLALRAGDVVVEAGPTAGGAPSTLVDLRGPAPLLVRPGAIDWAEIRRVLDSPPSPTR